MGKRDDRMNTILNLIIEDRKKGFKHGWQDYLIHLEPFEDAQDRDRALNRIHKLVSRSRQEINRAEESYIIQASSDSYIPTITTNSTTDITLEEYYSYAKQGKKINEFLDELNYRTSHSFEDPQVICFSSDHHLGSAGCDYDTLMSDFKFILENDVKLVLNGDMIEDKKEFPKNLFSVLSQVLSPSMQQDMVTKLLRKLKPQILSYVSGNHEVNARHGEENTMKRCCREAGIEFFEGACLMQISIGSNQEFAKYQIYARHKPNGGGKASPLLGARKLSQFESADIYVASHIHTPTWGVDWPMGKKRVSIISGTYNTNATYSRVGYGEYSARAEFPCVLLFPKTKRIMTFSSMRDAVDFRDMYISKREFRL